MNNGFWIAILWGAFLVFGMTAFTCYIRIRLILEALDRNLEEKPFRPQLQDKLRAYRDWCRDTDRKPYYLIFFGIGVIGAVLSWTPLPWLLYH